MRLKLKIFSILVFASASAFFACKQKKNSPFPGFDQTGEGVFYKRISIGDGKNIPTKGDSIYMLVVFTDTLGNVYFDSDNGTGTGAIGFYLSDDSYQNMFEKSLLTMVEGDSTHFIITADSLYGQSFNIQLPRNIKPGSLLYVFAKMLKHKTAKQLEFDRAQFKRWSAELMQIEDQKLKDYFNKKKITSPIDSTGIYILSLNKGNGKHIYDLASVFLSIKGYLIDGKEVENTCSPNQKLEYFPGQSGQVVKGIEIILGRLKQGGKATILVPSHLAYGPSGSSTGIIPPFSTIIYELEVN
jgi:FKBP-type peptidyl-prolyl cis-trans isomerase